MGIIRSIDRRKEGRANIEVALTVWGVDTRGENFLQEVHAHDISLSGALLSGLEADLRSGDVIGILYAGKKARYRVVWIRQDSLGEKLQVAIHRLSADACPWLELLNERNGLTEADKSIPAQTSGPSKSL